MSNLIIAPSLLAADALRFGEEIADVEAAGADWHHVDVMDGHFVPTTSYGVSLVKAFKKVSKIPLDVHIMVSNPDAVALDYVDAGADILSFHWEAAVHPHRIIQSIHKAGAKAGLALNPGTPLSSCFPLLSELDVVLLMSVNPGFGGQSFIEETVNRVSQLREEIRNRGLHCRIQVDGGINDQTAVAVCKAGADTLVAGTYVFGSKDRSAVVSALKNLCGKIVAKGV